MTKTIQHQSSQLFFGTNLEDKLNTILKQDYLNSKIVILTDENVFELWIENLITSIDALNGAEIIQLPAGEENKNIEFSFQVWETLSDYKIGRNDLIVNFGGGVITDMGGFIASTYKRGIDFINIPTTLLAQVDASVGGKTGVDLGGLKNQIGVFALPTYVFIDYKYLNTLSKAQITSGYAEMIKHGLIHDKKHWKDLISLKKLELNKLTGFIYNSVAIKHSIVLADPKESGLRKSLNFGHTIGHAFEGYLLNNNKVVPHGYAVAWGIIVESKIAVALNLLDYKSYLEIKDVIQNTYPKCPIKIENIFDVMTLMRNDKKNNGDEINFTLLTSIGTSVINQNVNPEIINENLESFLA